VDVDVESSVKELKESLEGITSVPVAQQRLIFKGRIMKDDNSLKSYGKNDFISTVLPRCLRQLVLPGPPSQSQA